MFDESDCPSEEMFDQYLHGQLVGYERAVFLQHLDDCEECFTVLKLISQMEDSESLGLLKPVSASYVQSVEKFIATLVPAAPRRSPLLGLDSTIGGTLGSLIAGLSIRFSSSSGSAVPRFAKRGDAPSDFARSHSTEDARAVHDALEFASPIDLERDGDDLVLIFQNRAEADQFLARLPAGLADRVVAEGNRLSIEVEDSGDPHGEIEEGTESEDGLEDSESTKASLSLIDDHSHRNPLPMHADPEPLVPIENAQSVFGLPGSELRSDEVYQHYSDTCVVRCQQLVLKQYGIDLTQEELMHEASHHGWYEKGEGIAAPYVGDLLSAHGVPVAKYMHANIFNLTAELARGHKVIIGVDSNDLWHQNPALESMRNLAGTLSPDHAVIVSGIDTTDPDEVKVVITDPGTGDVGKAYPMNEFLSAWKDSGFFMAATQVPAPLDFNPEMAHFDYKMGHLANIGHLSFDAFEHNFGACQGIDGTDSILRDQATEMLRRMDDHGPVGGDQTGPHSPGHNAGYVIPPEQQWPHIDLAANHDHHHPTPGHHHHEPSHDEPGHHEPGQHEPGQHDPHDLSHDDSEHDPDVFHGDDHGF
jgi:hypothetical protein